MAGQKPKQTPKKAPQSHVSKPKAQPKLKDARSETFDIVKSNLQRVFEARAARAAGQAQDLRADLLPQIKKTVLEMYTKGKGKSVEQAKKIYQKILDAMLRRSLEKGGEYEVMFDSVEPAVSFKSDEARNKAWGMLKDFVLDDMPKNVSRKHLSAYMRTLMSAFKKKLKKICYAWYGKNVSVSDLEKYESQLKGAFFKIEDFENPDVDEPAKVEFVGDLPLRVASMKKDVNAIDVKKTAINGKALDAVKSELENINKMSISNAKLAKLRFENLHSFFDFIKENGQKRKALLDLGANFPDSSKKDLVKRIGGLDGIENGLVGQFEAMDFGALVSHAKKSFGESVTGLTKKAEAYRGYRTFRKGAFGRIEGYLKTLVKQTEYAGLKKAFEDLRKSPDGGIDKWSEVKKKIEKMESSLKAKVDDFNKKEAVRKRKEKDAAALAKLTKGDREALTNPKFYKFILGIPIIGSFFAAAKGISNYGMQRLGLNPKKYFLLGLFRKNPAQTNSIWGRLSGYWKNTRIGKWIDKFQGVDGRKIANSPALKQFFNKFNIPDALRAKLAGSKMSVDAFLKQAEGKGFARYKGFVDAMKTVIQKKGVARGMTLTELFSRFNYDDLKSKPKSGKKAKK